MGYELRIGQFGAAFSVFVASAITLEQIGPSISVIGATLTSGVSSAGLLALNAVGVDAFNVAMSGLGMFVVVLLSGAFLFWPLAFRATDVAPFLGLCLLGLLPLAGLVLGKNVLTDLGLGIATLGLIPNAVSIMVISLIRRKSLQGLGIIEPLVLGLTPIAVAFLVACALMLILK